MKCQLFLRQLKKEAPLEMGKNYEEENFDKLFALYDDDKNGLMDKAEISVFIKKVFKVQDKSKKKAAAANSQANSKTLAYYLGAYTNNFKKDVDLIWKEADLNGDNQLDRKECE